MLQAFLAGAVLSFLATRAYILFPLSTTRQYGQGAAAALSYATIHSLSFWSLGVTAFALGVFVVAKFKGI